MPTIYFGYGSNLWQDQMTLRCPTSQYLGIARLNNYRWIINDRGYANVVQLPSQQPQLQESNAEVCWGLVYSLEPTDEARLDINEGVPVAYTKEDLTVDFWPVEDAGKPADIINTAPERRDMLVYIDRQRITPDVPKKEYIFRMNKGIDDALREGVPKEYVESVMRKFIPDVSDEKVEKLARKQALMFEDER